MSPVIAKPAGCGYVLGGISATVTSSTTTACGTTEIAGDYVLVTTKDGRVVPLPLNSVQTWVTTTRCP